VEGDPYKAVLFELVQYLAHCDERAAVSAFEWLDTLHAIATRDKDVVFADAVGETIKHLTLQQARRQLDRLSGLDDE